MDNTTPKFLPDRYVFLKSRLETDLLLMDEEVSQISMLVQDAAEKSAMAAEIRDSLKDAWNVVSSQVADRLRKEVLPSGKEKSEARIESEKLLDLEYQKARNEYAEARLDAGLWDSIVEGMRTKSQHIKTASDELLAGFISTDTILQKRREAIRKAVPRVPLGV